MSGRVTRGRERIRVRIIDISEGGLCLLAPVWLDPKQPAEIAIDVPGRATAKVRVEIWHIRREKSKTSATKVWIAGAILRDGDAAYAQLLEAAGLAKAPPIATSIPPSATSNPDPVPAPSAGPASQHRPSTPPTLRAAAAPTARRSADPTSSAASRATDSPAAPSAGLDAIEPRVFRLHCKAKGSPRTRVLTLAAETEEEARKLAEADLGREWDLLEVREV